MEIESVKALKAEVTERVVRPLLEEIQGNRRFGLAAGSIRRVTGVQRGVALGIGKGEGERDYRLAVRIQRRALESNVRQGIESIARGEADVRYVGQIRKRTAAAPPPWHRDRQRPLLIGGSVGHFAITAGTLGGFTLHRKTRRPMILSNNHVLANEDRAKIGDAILQPGVSDDGKKGRDRIGELRDSVPLKSEGANFADAAIASIDVDIRFDPSILTGLGELRGMRGVPAGPRDEVAKIGRTTGLTLGIITAIELDDVVIEYERGEISFDRQIEIEGAGSEAFSSPGDSGSLIVDREGRLACALLFAGSDQGGTNGKGLTYANDLSLVMTELNLELAVEELVA